MTSKLSTIAATTALLALSLTACKGKGGGTTSTGATPPNPVGATDFVSQPANGGGGGGRAGMGGDTLAGGAAPQSGTTNAAAGSSTPARTIQEADIYKVVGNTLYVLNQYRGLQILDVTDLSNPQLVSRVPVVGNPVDLYVEGTTAYVVVSDYFYWGWVDDGFGVGGGLGVAGAMPWIGSEVWAIDVTQAAAPKVLSTLPIDGEVDDTRIVGNILYVVSNIYSWYYVGGPGGMTNQDLTFVASFDISNPESMQPVQRLDFPAAGWNIHSNVTENRVILSETGYDQNSNGEITQFMPIDISDPAGALVLGNGFQASGMVADRWAMDFDGTSVFRAVLQADWGNTGGTLEIWQAPTVQTATPVGALTLNIPEMVTAASFDVGRAYLSTSACTDPLWIVDTSDPTQPKLTGSVTLSGALDFLDPQGNQLIALGHDSNGCNAWEGSGQMAVSMFDVTDPANPSLLSRVDFGSGYSYVSASADDMKKAFQVLPAMNLILVPFQSWDQTSYQYHGGTQLIDLNPTSLTLDGFAQHDGFVERAFPVQDKLVAFSDQTLQVIDASDRANPSTFAQLDLARPVLGLTVVGNNLVELSGDYTIGDTELAVTNAATPDQATPLATVSIPAPYANTFQDGNIMWILSTDWTNDTSWLQGVDVTNPLQPVQRGKLALDPTYAGNWYGGWYTWGYGDEAVIAGHALAIHRAYYGCYSCDYGPNGSGYQNPPDQVLVIDLSNPDAPTVAPPLTLPDSDWSWGLTAIGNFAWITHYEYVPNSNYGQVRYYLDRVDLTLPAAPQLLSKINVPGVFFAASADGSTIYTQDVTWASNYSQSTTWINQLQLLPSDTAMLLATVAINGSAGGAALNNGYAYVETWNYNSGSGTSQSVLTAINLTDMAVESSQALTSNWAWIMKATGGKLFVQAGWYDSGVVVYDLTAPGQPLMQGSIRTEGYIEDVVVSGNTAYLPSGEYGTPMIDLTPGAPLPNVL